MFNIMTTLLAFFVFFFYSEIRIFVSCHILPTYNTNLTHLLHWPTCIYAQLSGTLPIYIALPFCIELIC